MRDKIQTLRIVGNVEGWSYLILLFVAMPLKYLADIPTAVKIVGMAHGVLFIAFVAALILAATAQRWSHTFSAMAFVASIVPFGTFFLNKKLVRL